MFNTIIRTFYNNTKILLGDNVLLVPSWDGNNWGDALNPILIQKISGKHPLLVTRFTLNITDKPVFSVIGSILGNTRGGKNLVIWGTGFISNKGGPKSQAQTNLCSKGTSHKGTHIKARIRMP